MRHALLALLLTLSIVAVLVGIAAVAYLIYLAVTGHVGAWISLGVVLFMVIYSLAWRATGLEMNS